MDGNSQRNREHYDRLMAHLAELSTRKQSADVEYQRAEMQVEAEIVYQTERCKVLKLALQLIASYAQSGRMTVAVIPPMSVEAMLNAAPVSSVNYQVLEGNPHRTANAVQNVWNVRAEALSLAARSCGWSATSFVWPHIDGKG